MAALSPHELDATQREQSTKLLQTTCTCSYTINVHIAGEALKQKDGRSTPGSNFAKPRLLDHRVDDEDRRNSFVTAVRALSALAGRLFGQQHSQQTGTHISHDHLVRLSASFRRRWKSTGRAVGLDKVYSLLKTLLTRDCHKDSDTVEFQSCDADPADNPAPKPSSETHLVRRDSMTETSNPATTAIDHDSKSVPLLHDAFIGLYQRHGATMLPHAHEDDGQISCICGYLDDDGWTVACDYEDRSLPEDLQHFCIDCQPRTIDQQGARTRQQLKREEQASLVNGVKRQAPKSHKKKVKEPAYTNGWPLDKARHARNSASPRDQPPSAKRPKTTHRASDSVTNNSAKGHSRKRTATSVHHRRSPLRSSDSPIPLYSDEFVRTYQDDTWTHVDTILHDSIALANALSAWLSATEKEFRDMHGLAMPEMLMRWDGKLDDIPGKAHLDFIEHVDNRMSEDHNSPPHWEAVTVQEPVASGAYLGELTGRVGFREEYQQDPKNRWSLMRHPQPFVFFHSRLPIYIDGRSEGSELRYVRRSCKPNARLQILVTNRTTYHFCFMATQQIDPGVEVAIGWDTSGGLPELLRGAAEISQKDMQQLSSWVSTVLANCGPCACQRPDCLMARFDRREEAPEYVEDERLVKKTKKKNPGHQISPLNTHFNSPSGSEARKGDPDDKTSDLRSTSGSAGIESASRDITPNTYYSHSGSTSAILELSERERKKLAQEEEIFRRQEEERTGRGGKKRRNSGGSHPNMANTTSSKQLGFGSSRDADAGTLKQSGLPSAKSGRRPKGSSTQKAPVKIITKTIKRPKPDYINAEVQCDLDKEEAEHSAQTPRPKRPCLSTTQRLLHRCALNNARRRGPAAAAVGDKPAKADDKMDIDQSTLEKSRSPQTRPIQEPAVLPVHSESGEDHLEHTQTSTASGATSDLHVDTPVPPWPSQTAHSPHGAQHLWSHAHKPPETHIHMPPPSANPISGLDGHTRSLTGSGTVTQSPATLTAPSPIFSPSVTAAVTPSPAKKKMSLSDYTKRTKSKDKDSEPKTDRESSPASVASGPIASLVPSSSDAARLAESTSAIEDDVRMEDAGDASMTMSTV
ncbi:SET domain-containing protein 3 [Vermiconidia calcicola]|uniref:SET domain-containing protein 3 n=1 Tax=Vermiconidia calcicola TaxID=1690605 RepID=A0ACC3MG02_9PEZI|nr:SET domain-containing protein 3 [Vermiconidia calcicola]